MKRLTYAGIGSRQTPRDVGQIMTRIATALERRGWMLHSGGADGADNAFEHGVKDWQNARIFFAMARFQ